MTAEFLGLANVAVAPRAGRGVVRSGGVLLDHAWFRHQAARWRDALTARGERRWALHFEEVADFAPALYGAWHAGKEVYLCADVLPETLDRLARDVEGFAGDIPGRGDALALHRDPGDSGTAAGAEPWTALDPRQTRLVLYTSGSTGEPAAISKTLSQLDCEVRALEQAFGDRVAGTVVHGTVSHQHIYGLLFRVLWPLAAGRPVAPRGFYHEELVAALDGPAVLVSSPAHLKRMPEGIDWKHARDCLRMVFSSGGALPAEAAANATRLLGQVPVEVYGSSETGGIAWHRSDGAVDAPWMALPDVRWRVREGLLEVASPHLPDAGWHATADRVEAAGDGFRLLGRADRIVKVEERRVSLTGLERALAACPEVAEARVILLQGARAELGAVVVPSAEGVRRLREEGRGALLRALGRHLATRQDAATRPRRWRFVDALPANPQGKSPEAMLYALFRPMRPAAVWRVREVERASLELELDLELAVFDGHFPQLPILPGVAQLDWAVRFGREAFALPSDILRVDALKFQRVARPGERIRLDLDWHPVRRTLGFRYQSGLGPHSSGRVLFGEVGT